MEEKPSAWDDSVCLTSSDPPVKCEKIRLPSDALTESPPLASAGESLHLSSSIISAPLSTSSQECGEVTPSWRPGQTEGEE